jgi:hypothetical protein
MPKRQLQDDSPETLAAMAQALSNKRDLRWDEVPALCEFYARARIQRRTTGVFIISRRGVLVMRRGEGAQGADYSDHPLMLEAKGADRDFLTAVAILRRPLNTVNAVRARQMKASLSEQKIRDLLDAFIADNRKAASFVAQELGCTPQHVRKIRNKANLTTGRDSIKI